jgi:outer membrane immunogenic protein
MKKTIRISGLHGAAVALIFGSTVGALSQERGFYVKADAGGNITQDADLKEFFGPVAPDSKVKFDAGPRFAVAGGYQFTSWFALEGEVGFMDNKLDSITDASRVHDAWFINVPFLVNGKFQWPNRTPFTPYIGAGVGFSEVILDVDEISLGGTSLHGNTSDTVFAYQAFAGLRYRINERMGLSVEYHYLGADGAEWHADSTSGTISDRMKFGSTQTHSLSLAFDFRF